MARLRRIARGSKGLHPNPGKFLNCKRPQLPQNWHPIAISQGSGSDPPKNPGNAGTIFCNPGYCKGIRQIQGNPIAIDLNQHSRTGLRLDCKSAKDCKATEETAPKSMVLHNPRPDQSDFQAIRTAITMQITSQLRCNPPVVAISDCNRQNQLGLQQDCQVIEGLHQNLGKSPNCQKTSPIAPESASFRNRSGIRRICCNHRTSTQISLPSCQPTIANS